MLKFLSSPLSRTTNSVDKQGLRGFAMRCLVIGGGPSGLVMARHLREVMDVTVAECKDEIGGLWNYTEKTDQTTPASDLFKSLYGHQHGSIYSGMLLNIPLEITHTEDLGADPHPTSFPEQSILQQYLLKYTRHFDLRPLVRLHTAVTRITTLPDSTFECTLKQASGSIETRHFHRVVIANGHYSVPYIPEFPGLKDFPGPVWHSHNFRRVPEHKYKGQRLLMIGGGSSSWDMVKYCMYECPDIKQMCISTKGAKRASFFSSITDPLFLSLLNSGKLKIVSEVEKFQGKIAKYREGNEDEVDEIMLCTGYRFSFPFMPELQITEDGDYVKDFYRGVFWLGNPNLAMAGAHRGVLFLKLELVGKWLARDFLKKPDIDRWRTAYAAEEREALSKGLPLSSIFAQVDSPALTHSYFQGEGIDYDQAYMKYTHQLFTKTWALRQSHFFTYKTMKLS